ncbi:MAG: ankyrin repeat domain-containing protein [Bacteroidia bacterium]
MPKKENEIFDKGLSALYQKRNDDFITAVGRLNDLNFKDKDGRSMVFYAVLEKNLHALKLLIEKGADIILFDKQGWTPLHYAVNEHDEEISKILLGAGAEPNAKDKHGNTVIWRAVFASKGRGELIALLREYGADPSIPNDSGISAIKLAKTIANYDVTQFFQEED